MGGLSLPDLQLGGSIPLSPPPAPTPLLSFQYKYQAAVYILEWATPSLTVWYWLFDPEIGLVLVLVLLRKRPIISVFVFVPVDENNTVKNKLHGIHWSIELLMRSSAFRDRWIGKTLTSKGCEDNTTRLIDLRNSLRTPRPPITDFQGWTKPNTGCPET